MVANRSDDHDQNYDPWKKGNNIKNNYIGKHENEDSFSFLKNLLCKLNHKFGTYNNNNNVNSYSKNNFYYFLIIISVILVAWIISGFYTIKEAERGVVLRFGKFNRLVYPGLNWKPTFFDTVIAVNVESVRELAASGMMLTSDENVVRVEMNVQYRVIDPERYLFSVINADDSLRQATDSALRGVIGKYTMDRILTEGRTVVRSDTRHVLENTIDPYNMGITLLDVNFQTARPPEEVKAAFDDAIAARENEQQYIREAEAYANEVQPKANGQAQRILEEGRAYKSRTVLQAQGEVQRFSKVLPEYKASPKIMRERLYIDSMERVLSNTRKILVDEKVANNMVIFSSDSLNLHTESTKNNQKNNVNNINNLLRSSLVDSKKTTNTLPYQSNINHPTLTNQVQSSDIIQRRDVTRGVRS